MNNLNRFSYKTGRGYIRIVDSHEHAVATGIFLTILKN